MSVNAFGTLEQNLAFDLLHGFWGPLNMLSLELGLDRTIEGKLSITKKLIEKYLSKDGQPTVVDLQDERISELFDQAMKNMAQNTIEKALGQRRLMESLSTSAANIASILESFKPKTWTDYVKQGVDAAYNGLSRIGVVSKKPSTEDKTDIVLIEEENDWQEVETNNSCNKRISSILENWQKNPSILLEMDPTRKYIAYLRNELLPKARSIVEQTE